MPPETPPETPFEEGAEIPSWDMPSVSRARMRTMAAILRDPNPVHWDARLVSEIGYGDKTINQGPLGLSYMINMLHEWSGPGSVKRIFMTFPKVVLSEDHVVARGVIQAIREADGGHLVDLEIWLERDGERLLVGEATVLKPVLKKAPPTEKR